LDSLKDFVALLQKLCSDFSLEELENLKDQSSAMIKMVASNLKEFIVYSCGKNSAPIFAYRKNP